MNAHGFKLNQPKEYYDNFTNEIKSNGQIYAFDPKQNSNPETAYFNGMAMRVMRSLEFLKSLPQWDGKNLTAAGGSRADCKPSGRPGLIRTSRLRSRIFRGAAI